MQSVLESVFQRYDDPRLSGFVLDDYDIKLRCRYFITHQSPREWRRYLDSAEDSYGRHGVAKAVRRPELELHPCPSFWLIEGLSSGKLLGGMRNHGPYASADDVWGMQEMRSHPRYDDLVRVVEPLVARGVMENKGAFVCPSVKSERAAQVVEMLLRLLNVSIDMVGACAMIGTSAKHTMPMWRRAGCEAVYPHIQVPYPDDNYQTVLIANLVSQRERLMDPVLREQVEQDFRAIRERVFTREAI